MMSPPPSGVCKFAEAPLWGTPPVLSKGMVIITIPAEAKGVTMMVMPSTTNFPLRGHKPHDAVFSYSDFPNNCLKSGCMMLLCTEPIFFERVMHF